MFKYLHKNIGFFKKKKTIKIQRKSQKSFKRQHIIKRQRYSQKKTAKKNYQHTQHFMYVFI